MPRIDVVHGTDLKKGESTPGIFREKAFQSSNVLMSRTRLERGAVSGWHHHGTHELYGFLVSGQLRSEEHTSELQSLRHLVCRLLLEKKKKKNKTQSQ